jgi:hypothetical protein
MPSNGTPPQFRSCSWFHPDRDVDAERLLAGWLVSTFVTAGMLAGLSTFRLICSLTRIYVRFTERPSSCMRAAKILTSAVSPRGSRAPSN